MRFLPLLAALLPAAYAGCGPSSPACVTDLSTSCAPLYAPTFDNIFSRTLQPTCAQSGGVCHDATAAQGGLFFADADSAYQLLTESKNADGITRVMPGDPGCSLVMEKLESSDPGFQMPPGSQLSEAERCVFVQWIHDGAKR